MCKQLIDDYPEILKQLSKDSMSGKTKVWLVDDAHTELLAAPKRVMRNYHIETNCSAHDIMRAIKWLLDQCSVDYENVVITYIKRGDKNADEKLATSTSERKYKRDDKILSMDAE